MATGAALYEKVSDAVAEWEAENVTAAVPAIAPAAVTVPLPERVSAGMVMAADW